MIGGTRNSLLETRDVAQNRSSAYGFPRLSHPISVRHISKTCRFGLTNSAHKLSCWFRYSKYTKAISPSKSVRDYQISGMKW